MNDEQSDNGERDAWEFIGRALDMTDYELEGEEWDTAFQQALQQVAAESQET